MKQLLFALFMLTSYEMFGQVECLDEPICVVQFNAGWNTANGVDWCEGLSDCSYESVDIGADPSLATKYKIVVVPTIVIFKDGEIKVKCSLPADKLIITHDNFDLMSLLAQELTNAGMEAKYLEEEAKGAKG